MRVGNTETHEAFVAASPVPMWIQELDTIRFANEPAAEFFGCESAGDLVGESALGFVPEGTRERARERVEDLLETGGSLDPTEGEVTTVDGDRKVGQFAAFPAQYRGDDAIVVIARDVTDEHTYKRDLERQNERYREMLDDAGDIAFTLDADGRYDLVSERLAAVHDVSPEELEGQESLAAQWMRESGQWDQFQELVSGEREEIRLERDVEFAGYGEATADIRLTRHTVDGEFDSVIVVGRDISERKQRERELEQYEALINEVSDAVYMLDEDGRLTFVNEALAEFYGTSPADLVGTKSWTAEHIISEYGQDTYDALVRGDRSDLRIEATADITEEYTPVADISLTRLPRSGEFQGIVGVGRDVTEQKERERELQRERDRLETLFENLPNPVLHGVTYDGDYVVERVNPAFEETFGYSQDEIEGTCGIDAIVPDEYNREARERLERAMAEGSVSAEVERETADGRREFRIDMAVSNPDADNPERYSIYTDITERKERERELEKYRTLVESVGDPMFMLDADGNITMVNEAVVEQWGYDRDELLSMHASDLMPDEDYRRGTDLIVELLEDDDRSWGSFEMRSITADGEVLENENKIGVITDDGEYVATVGVIRDITERKERERELQWYEGIIENTRDTAAVFDENGRYKVVNSRLADLYDSTPDELRGERSRLLDEIADQHDGPDPFDELVAGDREEYRTEVALDYPSYEGRVADVRMMRLEQDGEFAGVVAVGRDISDRKERERELRMYEAIVEAIDEGVYVVNDDREIKFVNESYLEMKGTDRSDMLGTSITEWGDDEVVDEIIQRVQKLRRGERDSIKVEYDMWSVDGEHVPVELRITPLSMPEGDDGRVGIIRDMTERKQYERQLEEQRDQLEVLNRIVRHDINNDMNIVLEMAKLVREQIDDSQLETYLDHALESTRHTVELTRTARDLMQTMVTEDRERVPVSLSAVLEEQIADVDSSYDDATVRVEGGLPAVDVLADELLESVFRNILKNAVQHNHGDDPEVVVSTAETDETVTVRIADNGPGIPDDRKDEIFGKGEQGLESEGTGIGLYLVQSLVDSYGGEVHVEDREGGGSVFVVELETASE